MVPEAPRADGSKYRGPGRPPVDRAIEELIVLMAEENRSWGYDRIVGVLANLELRSPTKRWEMFCDATAYRARGSASARPHGRPSLDLALLAGTDFFTAEVLTLRGLATYYADPAAAIGRSRKPRKTLPVPVMPTQASVSLRRRTNYSFRPELAPLRSKNCKHRAGPCSLVIATQAPSLGKLRCLRRLVWTKTGHRVWRLRCSAAVPII